MTRTWAPVNVAVTVLPDVVTRSYDGFTVSAADLAAGGCPAPAAHFMDCQSKECDRP